MRLYFLSPAPAILKLNGEFAGKTDGFERYADIPADGTVMAEIVPGGNLQAVNFFIGPALFCDPPDFLEVRLADGEAFIYVKRFPPRERAMEVIAQRRFCGNLVTLFADGDIYLACEGAAYRLTRLGEKFKTAAFEERMLAGFPVLEIRGDGVVAIIGQDGELIFMNEAEVFYGQTLEARVNFGACTAACAICEYAYDGKKLTLIKSRTDEQKKPSENVVHFAFFESVLFYGDYAKYLSPALAPQAGKIREYLGDIAGVIVPTAYFYERHAEPLAAGLLYRKKDNLFEIKYFAVSLSDGKIDNIYPVE